MLGLITICSGLTQYMEEILTKLKHGEEKKIYSHKTDHRLYGLKYAGHTVILNTITGFQHSVL